VINPFKVGDKKSYKKVVLASETAAFEYDDVHPFYSTFALARDAEWSSRLFVLEMKEADEEGIGTFVNVKHLAPALVGEEVVFEAILAKVEKNAIVCDITARVKNRIIAKAQTGQKIIKRTKLQELHKSLIKE
jgi:fluoroacetyl-CoA thioesterase